MPVLVDAPSPDCWWCLHETGDLIFVFMPSRGLMREVIEGGCVLCGCGSFSCVMGAVSQLRKMYSIGTSLEKFTTLSIHCRRLFLIFPVAAESEQSCQGAVREQTPSTSLSLQSLFCNVWRSEKGETSVVCTALRVLAQLREEERAGKSARRPRSTICLWPVTLF